MKRSYIWLLFTLYPLIPILVIWQSQFEKLFRLSELARYVVGGYLGFGFLYLCISLLWDCSHRDFDKNKTKSLWFIGLLTLPLVIIPVYLYKVVNLEKIDE